MNASTFLRRSLVGGRGAGVTRLQHVVSTSRVIPTQRVIVVNGSIVYTFTYIVVMYIQCVVTTAAIVRDVLVPVRGPQRRRRS